MFSNIASDFVSLLRMLPSALAECWGTTRGVRWLIVANLVLLAPAVACGWWWLWVPCQVLWSVGLCVWVSDRLEREGKE